MTIELMHIDSGWALIERLRRGPAVNGTELNGKVAVVTGGASGIGKAISASLAAHQAQVWVLDINPAAAQQSAAEIKAAQVDELRPCSAM